MRLSLFLLSYLFVLTSNSIFAMGASVSEQSELFNGIYVGLGAGIVKRTGRIRWTTNASALDVTSIFDNDNLSYDEFENSADVKSRDHSAKGSLFFGYGHEINQRIYLGGQIGIAFSNVYLHTNGNSNSLFDLDNHDPIGFEADGRLRSEANLSSDTVELNGDLKLGILSSSKTLWFGLIGLVVNKMKFNTSSHFHYSLTQNEFIEGEGAGSLALSQSKTEAGLRLGIGVEHFITSHFTIGLVYLYTHFGSFHLDESTTTNGSYIVGDQSETPGQPIIENWTIDKGLRSRASITSIDNQTVMLNLTYYFHA